MTTRKFPLTNQRDKDAAVRRYYAGEQVSALAKEYGVSKPCFYLWINKHKAEANEAKRKVTMSPESIHKAEMYELQQTVKLQVREIYELKDCIVQLTLRLETLQLARHTRKAKSPRLPVDQVLEVGYL